MAEAGIRELRDHLSCYLTRVQAGEELTGTDRGRPVARLIPVGEQGSAVSGSVVVDFDQRQIAAAG